MKNIISLILFSFLLVVLVASCSETIIGPLVLGIGNNNPESIVAFGDSISHGRGSTDENGYRKSLEQLFRDEGRVVTVYEEGEPGTLSATGVKRIENVLAFYRPALIIILYGTNDEQIGIPKSIRLTEQEKAITRQNLVYMVAAARNNKTIVIMSTLTPVCGEAREYQLENIIEMNEEIRAVAESLGSEDKGVLLADPYTAFVEYDPDMNGCSLIGDRDVHPTDEGYQVMAQTYHDVLRDIFW